VRQRHCQVVWIAGEAGIGKTSGRIASHCSRLLWCRRVERGVLRQPDGRWTVQGD